MHAARGLPPRQRAQAHDLVAEQYAAAQRRHPARRWTSRASASCAATAGTRRRRAWIKDYFFREVMPVLTPIGLDPAHPFPRVLNKSLNFAVELEGKDAFGRSSGAAIVQAPRVLPRVIRLPHAIAGVRARLRLPVLHPARPCRRAVRRHERARLLPVPRHAQQRPVRGRGGNQEPAPGIAGRTAAAPLRRRRAPGGGRQLLATPWPTSCCSSSRWATTTSTACTARSTWCA